MVLAAGASRRFGSPKAAMRVGARTALEAIVAAARQGGIAGIVVVTGADRTSVAPLVERCGAVERWNEHAERGMMSSVRVGVSALAPGVDALVWPVDHPFVRAGTIARIIAERDRGSGSRAIVVPAFEGRGGHPTLFASGLLPELVALDDTGGPNRLLASHRERVYRVAVPDAGVIADIDRPEDLDDALALHDRAPIDDHHRGDDRMASTADNLKDAFAGESQANQKYLAFADKAEQEGMPNIARLFRTAAAAERIHAGGHLSAMGGLGSTAENLEAAIGGETYEYTEMYPPMLELAQADAHRATRMFGYAMRAERVHAELYAKALEAARQGKDLSETRFYLCPVCGNIEMGEPPEKCPICGALAKTFVLL